MGLAQAGWRPWQAELLHICERYASTGELKAATTKIKCDAHGTRRAGGRTVSQAVRGRAAGQVRGRREGGNHSNAADSALGCIQEAIMDSGGARTCIRHIWKLVYGVV